MEKENQKDIKKMQKDLGDPKTVIEHSIRKIGLLRDFLSHNIPDSERFSKNGEAGFHHVLADIEDDLEIALTQLFEEDRDLRKFS